MKPPGSAGFTIVRFADMTIWWQLLDTWLRIRCVRVWFRRSGTILIGIQSGCNKTGSRCKQRSYKMTVSARTRAL